MSSHPLNAHRDGIDAALAAGASKASVARALGVSRATFKYYLDTRDLVRKDDTGAREALERLAALATP